MLFLVKKIGPELAFVVKLPIFFLHKAPVQLYILVVISSSSSVWDAATAWLAERCVGLQVGSEPANPSPTKQSL